MVTPEQIQQAISRVNDQASFIQGLLYDTLQWPVDGGIEKVEDTSPQRYKVYTSHRYLEEINAYSLFKFRLK